MFPRLPRRLARLFIPGALALGLLLLLLGVGNQGAGTGRDLLYLPGRLSPGSSSAHLRLAIAQTSSQMGQRRSGVDTATTTTTTVAPLPGDSGGGGGGGVGSKVLLQRIGSAATAAATVLAKAGAIRAEDIVNPHPFGYLINPGEAACRSVSKSSSGGKNVVVKAGPSATKDHKALHSNRTHSSKSDISNKNNTTRTLVQNSSRTWGVSINSPSSRTRGQNQNRGDHDQTRGQKGRVDHEGQGEGESEGESQGHVWLLVYVHSAPANLKKRQSIRETWGQPAVLREHNATLVFILGAVQDPHLQELVLLESERYGDIVQENFTDSYRNLTYKAIAGLRWAASFCSHAAYILKTDDDILVNLYAVVKHIRTVVVSQYGAQRLILCNQWYHMRIIRDKKSKWYVPEKEFPGEYFPTYCSGSAFLLSGDMAQLMYEASLVTPFFWVDDYYITGALIERLAVKHRSINQAYSLNPSVAEEKFRKDAKRELFFFHLHNLRVMYGLWMNMTLVHEASSSSSSSSSASTSSLLPSLASH